MITDMTPYEARIAELERDVEQLVWELDYTERTMYKTYGWYQRRIESARLGNALYSAALTSLLVDSGVGYDEWEVLMREALEFHSAR